MPIMGGNYNWCLPVFRAHTYYTRTISSLHSIVSKTSKICSNKSRIVLTNDELKTGCRLGFDTWADTCCAGRHAHVESFVIGKSVSASGFSSSLPTMHNLPIANVSYAYDTPEGETFILEVNNSIYLGKDMEDSLLCPNQCQDNGVLIDLRPKVYFPDESTAQNMHCPSHGMDFPIHHFGPMPYINIRQPSREELESCSRIELTSPEDWDPYSATLPTSNIFSSMSSPMEDPLQDILDASCPTSISLMNLDLPFRLEESKLLHVSTYLENGEEAGFSTVGSFSTRKRDSLTAEDLSRLWCIGLKTAKRTLLATTHQCLRTAGVLSRRFRTDKAHMRYKRLATKQGLFYVDTLLSKIKSIRGFTCGDLYTNNLGFRKFFPMETQSESPHALQHFIEIVGIPPTLHSDNAKVFSKGAFVKKCKKFDINKTYTEPISPWQNRAESGIKEVKKYGRRLMERENAPLTLWCFAYEHAADILSLLASGVYQLGGRTPYEHVMHYTPDISEYVTFRWYQWSYYWDELEKEKKLCRWLGVAHKIGQSMCYWILLSNGEFIARSTVIPIPDEDLCSDELKRRTEIFTTNLHLVIGSHEIPIEKDGSLGKDKYVIDLDNDDDEVVFPWESELEDVPLHDDSDKTQEDLDEYIGANVIMPGDDGVEVLCSIRGRKRDANGRLIGARDDNPILDTRVFQVEYPDGHLEEYATNKIAEALYSNVDNDGFDTGILYEIVDHRKRDSAVNAADGYIITSSGQQKPVITTKGWELQVLWEDGSQNWLKLSQLKESNPIEVAEYAFAKEIQKEPAFNWWVSKVLRRRERLINKVSNRRTRKGRMKFGIEIPNSVEEAKELDLKNGNTYWADAIQKEFKNVNVAFDLVSEDERVPVGYKQISCHLIFDVKFDLTRKARYVAGGHMTDPPASITYASVVSRESVRIAFLVAALNGLDVLTGDIQNAYLNAHTTEKVWFRAGREWGANEGRAVVIVRALYGLKSSGQAWRSHLADTLTNVLGFRSCLADPDVWLKPTTKADGSKVYSYILVYTDDILICDEHPKKYMDLLESQYRLKKGSIGPPKVYLGANVQQVETRIPGPDRCWGISAEQYVRDAVKGVKKRLKEEGYEFNKRLSDVRYSPRQPYSTLKYRPEIDTSTPCTDNQAEYYQNLIGILRWIVELGRIDIHFEVACLSQYLVYPRIGHLYQVFHVFKYLDTHCESFLSFDPTRLSFIEPLDESSTNRSKAREMKRFYPDAEERMPTNAPAPRGKPVQINTFVDADHAGNLVTRRSHSGILIFLNMAPISWYSKRQNSVETSTFSSEFVALKIATELIIALRYKLRMMGIPIDGPANVFCDNEAVYKNAIFADSTLKKKHNSVAYHKVRESVAAEIVVVIKEDSGSNLADILTKSLPPDKRKYLRERIMIDEKVNSLITNVMS